MDAGRDVFVCPADQELIYRYTTEERGVQLRRYRINQCQTGPPEQMHHRHGTCGSLGGSTKTIKGSSRDPDLMTLRRYTVEHPFGTIKGWMGAIHFLTRRLKNVRTEMALNVLAYNISECPL